MESAIIVAIANNNAIGYKNRLLCHLPADLKMFKQKTSGHTVVMGRKTFESLPKGALPNRRNLVLSRSKFTFDGCETVESFHELWKRCASDEKIFILGGADVYKQSLDWVDHLFITRIHADFEADTFFPDLDMSKWVLHSSEPHKADEINPYDFTFEHYLIK